MTSLLPEIDIADAMEAHGTARNEQATKEYSDAFGTLFATVKETIEDVAGQHSKPVSAMQAATQFCTGLTDFLTDNADRIAQGFGPNGQVNAFSSQAQRLELEQAERRVEQYRVTAERASELQNELIDAQGKIARLERELDEANRARITLERQLQAAQGEITQLKQQADKPNPLTAENAQLKREKATLERQLQEARDEITQLKQPPAPSAPDLQSGSGEQPAEAPGSQSGDTSFIAGTMDRQNGGSSDEPPAQGGRPGIRERVKGRLMGDRIDRRND